MSTQLARVSQGGDLSIYDRFTDAKSAIAELAHDIAASGIMGVNKPAQGKVLALECFARKCPPLMLAQRFDIIHDKLSMKSDAMRTDFEEKGAKFRLVERTPDVVSADLERDGVIQRFTLTWEEARLEPFPYQMGKGVKEDDIIDQIEAGNPPKLKPKYRTPRSRMQMLWQRLVSDSVRAMDPSVVCGMYSAAEIEDLPENASKPGLSVTSHDDDDDVVDAEVVSSTVADAPVEKPAANKPKTTTVNDSPAKSQLSVEASTMCTAEQSTRIKVLWGELGATVEQRNKQLESRGVTTCRQLTTDQATELIGKLEAAAAKRKSDPATSATATQQAMTDAELAVGIRERLKQVNQVHPGTTSAFKAKMADAKIGRIDDLSRESLQELYDALDGPDIMAWFGQALFTPRAAKN